METLSIIMVVALVISGLLMLLTSFGIFTDKNKNNIPDYLDDKFKELKDEISKLKKCNTLVSMNLTVHRCLSLEKRCSLVFWKSLKKLVIMLVFLLLSQVAIGQSFIMTPCQTQYQTQHIQKGMLLTLQSKEACKDTLYFRLYSGRAFQELALPKHLFTLTVTLTNHHKLSGHITNTVGNTLLINKKVKLYYAKNSIRLTW